jgi:hypothetical protein
MPRTCKSHPSSVNAKVAIKAIKAHKTNPQITQIWRPPDTGWGRKKQALARLASRTIRLSSRY